MDADGTPESPQERDAVDVNTVTLPIPIRRDLIVKLIGVPHDLTPQEAKKIANVVSAMASD